MTKVWIEPELTADKPPFTDITAPHGVEICIRHDGKVIWVNVDGRCLLRCCQIENLSVQDKRPQMKGRKQ